MTKNSQPYNLEEILAGYVLGDLDEAELVWINEQLRINPQLRAEVTQLETTLNLMPYGLPDDVPQNNDLRDQILAQAKPIHRTSKYRWSWIISAVSAVSALWLGVNNFNLRQQIASQDDRLQQQQELLALMRQPNNRLLALAGNEVQAASGSLFISPSSKTAVLALQNLKPLTGQQVYRLWAVSQEQKTGCASFKPDSQGSVHLRIASDDALFDANSVLITIEPEADTEQPLGSAFLTGSASAI
ncbi:MAG: anti-sigma factor [Cyanobacteria bacterium P01_G01_bin.39]